MTNRQSENTVSVGILEFSAATLKREVKAKPQATDGTGSMHW